MILDGITPQDIGLPDIFPSFRPIQDEAIEEFVYSSKRFVGLALPTGAGKSLTVMAIQKLTGMRTVILTSTLGLADQYIREFAPNGNASVAKRVARRMGAFVRPPAPGELVDIRGRSNYTCSEFTHVSCLDGPKMGCTRAGSSACEYTGTLGYARAAQVDVTNYPFWMNINSPGSSGLCDPLKVKPIDLLILDEAHLAPEELARHLSIELNEYDVWDCLRIKAPNSDSLSEWVAWAKEWYPTVDKDAKAMAEIVKRVGHLATKAQLKELADMDTMTTKLGQIKAIKKDSWVCEMEKKRTKRGSRYQTWKFDPVWIGQYAESVLFKNIPHVLMVSATIRPKTIGLLGAKVTDTNFREWPRVFPEYRCPVYHLPAVRMKHEMPDADLQIWVNRIDEIITSRLDRKGIIHTVSYDRQEYLLEHSVYGRNGSGILVGNTADPDSPKAAKAVKDFRDGVAPLVLTSPSFSTGWDFPGEECEWIIVCKVPFPNTNSKIMKERIKRDPQYASYLTVQELVQSCGRGMRSFSDRCEVFIVDDSIGWFINQNKFLVPKWFTVRRMERDIIPPVPPSLSEEKRKRTKC